MAGRHRSQTHSNLERHLNVARTFYKKVQLQRKVMIFKICKVNVILMKRSHQHNGYPAPPAIYKRV